MRSTVSPRRSTASRSSSTAATASSGPSSCAWPISRGSMARATAPRPSASSPCAGAGAACRRTGWTPPSSPCSQKDTATHAAPVCASTACPPPRRGRVDHRIPRCWWCCDRLGADVALRERDYLNRQGLLHDRALHSKMPAAYIAKLRATVRQYAKNLKALGELANLSVDCPTPHLENDDLSLAQAGLEVRFDFDRRGAVGPQRRRGLGRPAGDEVADPADRPADGRVAPGWFRLHRRTVRTSAAWTSPAASTASAPSCAPPARLSPDHHPVTHNANVFAPAAELTAGRAKQPRHRLGRRRSAGRRRGCSARWIEATNRRRIPCGGAFRAVDVGQRQAPAGRCFTTKAPPALTQRRALVQRSSGASTGMPTRTLPQWRPPTTIGMASRTAPRRCRAGRSAAASARCCARRATRQGSRTCGRCGCRPDPGGISGQRLR